ncbi:MAG: peptidase A26, partial [Thermoplasmata archaeon]|nr:peptidase A26 [Thermoplasmata archaeon]
MRKREGLYSISLVILLIISGMTALISIPDDIFPINISKDANAFFAGGNGTASNPYQISNVTQLQNMSSDLSAHYIILNDINASETIDWNNGTGFDPIGNKTNSFNGSLDGQGFNITDLVIDSTEYYVGLIGHSEIGTVINLSLIDNDVTGDRHVGGLVGYNDGTVSNCSAKGNVTGDWYVGGLVGQNSGTVFNCSTTGNVSGDDDIVGGLVGYN